MPGALDIFRRVLVAALTLAIAGCGFQLRGTSTVPDALQPLALECSDPVPDRLCRAIESQLELGEVRTADADSARTILRLSDFRQERRANAVTARASAAEYTLRQSVGLEVISADDKPLLATERVTSAETYRYDEANVLAKQQEEESLQDQLADRLAQQVLFRLAPLNQTRLDALEAEE
jgi:LPS-assembly lipoprotein